ncbi:energy transducer TonB [Fluviicola sp.]|uniref:energy transducer TonB n=1 Tax=Fluviicola sp. TaxID=1917219 RepID=UPI0031DF941D
MKFLLFFFLIVGFHAFAQDTLCDNPDEAAQFPGGSGAFKAFIDKNLIYPEESLQYEGLCFVSFLVCEDGTCQNFKVSHGVSDCPDCDREAILMLQLMPKWKPALRNGKPVPVKHSVKIVFRLQDVLVSEGIVEKKRKVAIDNETPAEFPGGTPALNRWLGENMHYPQEALDYGLTGKCYVKFVVGADGVCRDFKILRGVRDCLSCDLEALRLFSIMPKWNPATKEDKPLEVSMRVAITFKLN